MADTPVVQQGTEGSGTAAGQGTAPQYADAATVAALQGTISELQRQLNGLSAAQRAAAKKAPEAGTGTSGEQAPNEQQTLTLKSLKSELETRDKRVREKAITTEINAFCNQAQIPKGLQPFFRAYVKEQHMQDGAKLRLTTNANDEVGYEDELGDWKPFETLGKQILSTNDGASFLSPVSTPGGVGGRTNAGVNRGAQQPDLSNLSQQQLSVWMQAHPAEAEEMMRQKALALSGAIRT